MIINDLKYSLFCCTFNVKVIDKGYFKSIFYLNNIPYEVDDLKPYSVKEDVSLDKISSCV